MVKLLSESYVFHFDALNKHPPPPKMRFSSALPGDGVVALETDVEDRIVEAADALSGCGSPASHFVKLYTSLENDLKFFHT
jgi:hypothetical protein